MCETFFVHTANSSGYLPTAYDGGFWEHHVDSGWGDAVDGRNPAPVEMENLPLFTGFCTCQVVSRISEPSTVPLLDQVAEKMTSKLQLWCPQIAVWIFWNKIHLVTFFLLGCHVEYPGLKVLHMYLLMFSPSIEWILGAIWHFTVGKKHLVVMSPKLLLLRVVILPLGVRKQMRTQAAYRASLKVQVDVLLNGLPEKTVVLIRVYNQHVQGTILFMVGIFVWWPSPIAGNLIEVSSTRISRLCWQPKLHEGLCQPRRSFRKCWRCWRERSCLAQGTMACWRQQRMKPTIGVLEVELPSSCVWAWGWTLCLFWMAYISEPSLVDQQKVVQVYVDKLRRIHHLPDPVAHPHLFQMQKSPSITFSRLKP